MTETIGRQLKEARQGRGLTIQQAVRATHIRAQYLEAIEMDDFSNFASQPQVRGFIHLYANFLGLSWAELIANQQPEPPVSELAPQAPYESKAADSIGAKFTSGGTEEPQSNNTDPVQPGLAEVRSAEEEPDEVETGKIRPIETEPQLPEPGEIRSSKAESADTRPGYIPPAVTESAGTGFSTVPIAPAPPIISTVIFTAIGEQLRQRRELLGLSLDEIEQHTHVRKHYLQALETGRFEQLPSSVQAKGMLNNYARFMDMDMDAILLRFAEALQAQRIERQPQPAARSKPHHRNNRKFSSMRRFMSLDLLFGGGLIVILLIFAIWGTRRIISLRTVPAQEATAPSISDILLTSSSNATPTPEATTITTPTQPLPPDNLTAVAAVPTSQAGRVQVYIVVQERTWMRIIVDGKVAFDGRALPGSAYPFDGNQQIEVLTGNGAALQIIYNQADLGVMGGLGDVVDLIYTVNTILKPTPTFTPSPTSTPRESPTPTLTSTPAPIASP